MSPLEGVGKVYIPGVDKYQIKSYYPEGEKWEHAPPGAGERGMDILARDVIPIFPDDPKARFLDDLKLEGQISAMTLGQFWELMEHRQECSSGRLVGFISTYVKASTARDTDDGVVVDEKTFMRAYEMLLNGEYSSVEIASGATGKWIQSIQAIIPTESKEKWGFDLVPSGVEETKTVNGPMDTKKRPAETKLVNMLGGGLVRKKPKT